MTKRANRPVSRKKVGRVGDLRSLKSIERGLEEEQRYNDREFPKELPEDYSLKRFRKGGMVGRDYCK